MMLSKEDDRIKALHRYDILDTPPDGTFDNITALVTQFLNVPIAIVSLVDEDRIWFKSHYGIDVEEVDRVPGLCASAILGDLPYILNDASLDPRSLANPLVAGDLGLRFYAGVPLRTKDNHNLGVLCGIDFEPRTVSDTEINVLKTLASVVMDEMELRLSARRIHKLRQEKDHIIQSVSYGVVALDRHHRVTEWNKAAEEMTGFSRSDILHKNLGQLRICTAANEKSTMMSFFKKGMETNSDEIMIPKIDGSSFPAEVMFKPIKIDDQVNGTVVVFQDISEKKRTLEYLHRLDKLKMCGQMAASVAHKIRNPLTTIKGFMALFHPRNEEAKYAELIEDSIHQIEQVVDEFVLLSKPRAKVWQTIDIPDLLQNVKFILSKTFDLKKVEINIHSNDNIPFIYGDYDGLRQMFMNIFTNAIESMPDGGTMIVKCTSSDAENVLVQISDTGCGMSKETIKNLGEPFYSTKEKGTGIGLMVCYNIVQQHNGHVRVSSVLDKGTEVEISLPALK